MRTEAVHTDRLACTGSTGIMLNLSVLGVRVIYWYTGTLVPQYIVRPVRSIVRDRPPRPLGMLIHPRQEGKAREREDRRQWIPFEQRCRHHNTGTSYTWYVSTSVFFTLSRYFYPSTSSTTSVRADSSILERLTLLGLQTRFGDNWGKNTWSLSGLSRKRDWSSKGVKVLWYTG